MTIDWWTLGLQIVNFLVLVLLLQRFLLKPVQAAIARRQAETNRVLAEAEAAKQSAEETRRALETEHAAAAAERARLIDSAHAEAQAERKRILDAAQAEADATVEAARGRVADEVSAADTGLRERAARLGIGIARRLLRATVGPAVGRAFLEGICARLQALSPEERAAILESGADGDLAVRVVTADPLSAEDRAHCRERLGAVLGPDLSIDFVDDADLIAGIEVHFPHSILRHSWRDALASAQRTVTSDDRAA